MITTANVVQFSISFCGGLSVVESRVRQFIQALTYRQVPAIDTRLKTVLDSDQQWELLRRLSPFDRAHHLNVWSHLVEEGVRDPDLLQAALLHDVGKADGDGRVRLIHRIMLVLGRRVAPDLIGILTTPGTPYYVHGLYLADNHAELGAELAWEAGASQRSCYFIAMHENVTLAANDDSLRALMLADSEVYL